MTILDDLAVQIQCGDRFFFVDNGIYGLLSDSTLQNNASLRCCSAYFNIERGEGNADHVLLFDRCLLLSVSVYFSPALVDFNFFFPRLLKLPANLLPELLCVCRSACLSEGLRLWSWSSSAYSGHYFALSLFFFDLRFISLIIVSSPYQV